MGEASGSVRGRSQRLGHGLDVVDVGCVAADGRPPASQVGVAEQIHDGGERGRGIGRESYLQGRLGVGMVGQRRGGEQGKVRPPLDLVDLGAVGGRGSAAGLDAGAGEALDSEHDVAVGIAEL